MVSTAEVDELTASTASPATPSTPATVLHPQPEEASPETMQVAPDDKSVYTVSTISTQLGKDSKQIRSRLLNRLGIYGTVADGQPARVMQSQPMTAAQHRRVRILRGMGVGYTMTQSPPDGSAQRDILGNVVPFKEELKYDYPDEAEIAAVNELLASNAQTVDPNSPTSATDAPANAGDGIVATPSVDGLPPKTTRIAFQNVVDVMPIPTRHEYSDRIKSRIWSNRHELQENAERNAVEFASEGWKWENVIEDEGMYICSASGELVHPAWVGDIPRAATTPSASSMSDSAPQEGASPSTSEPRLERGNPAHNA